MNLKFKCFLYHTLCSQLFDYRYHLSESSLLMRVMICDCVLRQKKNTELVHLKNKYTQTFHGLLYNKLENLNYVQLCSRVEPYRNQNESSTQLCDMPEEVNETVPAHTGLLNGVNIKKSTLSCSSACSDELQGRTASPTFSVMEL